MDEIVRNIKEKVNNTSSIYNEKLGKVPYNQKTKLTVKKIDKALHKILEEKKLNHNNISITEIAILAYAGAEVVLSELGIRIQEKNRNTTKPKWKMRIEEKITKLRKDLSQITEISQGNESSRMQTIKKRLYSKYNIKNKADEEKTIETLKQNVQAKAQRIRRFEERHQFYKQNQQFKDNPKQFYKTLNGKNIKVEIPPETTEVKKLWQDIWETPEEHNQSAEWIQRHETRNEEIEEMIWQNITAAEVKSILLKSSNWKAPGIDGIQNYWLKKNFFYS